MKEYFVVSGFNKKDNKIQYLCSESCVGWFWSSVFSRANFYTSMKDAQKVYDEIVNEKPSSNGDAPYHLRCLAGINIKKRKDIVNVRIEKICFEIKVEQEIKVEDNV